MEIRCRCTACQTKFKIDGKYAGKKARCPKCQQIVEVPKENLEASTTLLSSLAVGQPATGNSALAPPKSAAQGEAKPAAPAKDSAGAFSVFQIQTAAKPAPGKTTSPAAAPATRPRKKSNAAPLVIGGSLAALLLLLGGIVAIVALSGSAPIAAGGGTAGGASSARGSGVLVLDWPDGDRPQAALSIDGRREMFAQSGELKFTLSAGTHRVFIQRRGYEPFEAEVTLAGGGTQRVSPQWNAVAGVSAVAASPNAPASPAGSSPAVSNVASGSFPIGTAVPALSIHGFDGWLQSLDQAKRQAAAENKEILILFGISDIHSQTQQLRMILQSGSLRDVTESMVRVVIDFPRTASAKEMVQDSAQNVQLVEEFGVQHLPALALADETGRVYFFKEEWDEGPQHVRTQFTSWKQQRAQRDPLLAATLQGTPEERLAAAVTAVNWLQEQEVWRFHRTEIESWFAEAQRTDPENKRAVLEAFFEPHWFLDWLTMDDDDAVAVRRLVTQLAPWGTRKFKDHDRGVKLHIMAAQLLLNIRDEEESLVHFEHAAGYHPKDAELADAMRQLRVRLENRDIAGNGTGYLISPAGYVLTNHHVIEGPGAIALRVPGSKENIPAQLIAQDEERDVALLKVTLPESAQAAPLAIAAEPARRGAAVAAFGYPLLSSLGAGLKFTDGSVSALPDDTNDQMYLLDLTVNPGNSGGPLCDQRGNVVGMITAMTGNFGFENSYGLAIPAADLLKFLDEHLPPGTPRAAADTSAANLGWDQIDEKVSSGVLMILKKR